ncbi:MAG: TIGR04282 family arsenosugar biosynthesis glycosyltransferase [Synechocystis sp.]|nr:TIGR04282 family arsenosugar biosynthesis glycosyltransferase [Synechocystis sp.]
MGLHQLLIFTRFPVPGRTKTRLIPALGPGGAASLQRQLTEHVVKIATQLSQHQPIAITLVYTGGTETQMQQWLGTDLDYASQQEGDLGDRLQGAFQAAFAQGSDKVMVIGIDCPFITSELLITAFEALDTHQAVIGPALDGGYYLLGLTAPRPQYFQQIDWGTDQVYAQTLAKIEHTGEGHQVLPPLPDIDRPPDLAHLTPQFSHWLSGLDNKG